MSMYQVIANIIWSLTVVLVAISEYRMGKKVGRREAYAEGHRHGVEDTLRQLGVPAVRSRDFTLVIDVSKLVEEELAIVREASRKGAPS